MEILRIIISAFYIFIAFTSARKTSIFTCIPACDDQACDLRQVDENCLGVFGWHSNDSWPGKPHGLEFRVQRGSRSSLTVKISFFPPDDVSVKSVRGFQLGITLVNNGYILPHRFCYVMNVTRPITMDQVTNRLAMKCNVSQRFAGIVVSLHSLPRPSSLKIRDKGVTGQHDLRPYFHPTTAPIACRHRPNVTVIRQPARLVLLANQKPVTMAYTVLLISERPCTKVVKRFLLGRDVYEGTIAGLLNNCSYLFFINYTGCKDLMRMKEIPVLNVEKSSMRGNGQATPLPVDESTKPIIIGAIFLGLIVIVVIVVCIICAIRYRNSAGNLCRKIFGNNAVPSETPNNLINVESVNLMTRSDNTPQTNTVTLEVAEMPESDKVKAVPYKVETLVTATPFGDIPLSSTGNVPSEVAPNGVATNGVASDGVASDGVASDGVASDGVASDGVTQNERPVAQGQSKSDSGRGSTGDGSRSMSDSADRNVQSEETFVKERGWRPDGNDRNEGNGNRRGDGDSGNARRGRTDGGSSGNERRETSNGAPAAMVVHCTASYGSVIVVGSNVTVHNDHSNAPVSSGTSCGNDSAKNDIDPKQTNHPPEPSLKHSDVSNQSTMTDDSFIDSRRDVFDDNKSYHQCFDNDGDTQEMPLTVKPLSGPELAQQKSCGNLPFHLLDAKSFTSKATSSEVTKDSDSDCDGGTYSAA